MSESLDSTVAGNQSSDYLHRVSTYIAVTVPAMNLIYLKSTPEPNLTGFVAVTGAAVFGSLLGEPLGKFLDNMVLKFYGVDKK